MFSLKDPFGRPTYAQNNTINTISRAFDNIDNQILQGVTGSGKTYMCGHIINQLNRPTLVLCPNKLLVDQTYRELQILFPDNAVKRFVSYFDLFIPESYVPSRQQYTEKISRINEAIGQERIDAVTALIARRDVIIVASVSAIYGAPEAYLDDAIKIEIGDQITCADFINVIKSIGFKECANAESYNAGMYKVKEENILSIKTLHQTSSHYIQWDESHVINITKKGTACQSITLYRNDISVDSNFKNILKKIETDLNRETQALYAKGDEVSANRLNLRVRHHLNAIETYGRCSGFENYLAYFSDKRITLLNHFKNYHPDFLTILDESHLMVPQLQGAHKTDLNRKKNLVEYGFYLSASLKSIPLTWEEVQSTIGKTLYVSATPGKNEYELSQNTVQNIIRPTGILDPVIEVRPKANQLDDIIKSIQANKTQCIVASVTKSLSEKIYHYLRGHNIACKYIHCDLKLSTRLENIEEFKKGLITCIVGINLLREGVDLPQAGNIYVMEADRTGFLRSYTALMQLVGRVARNVNGKAILYADNITPAIKSLLDTSTHNRSIQQAYNLEHSIIPKSTTSMNQASKSTVPLTMQEMEVQLAEAIQNQNYELAHYLEELISKTQNKI